MRTSRRAAKVTMAPPEWHSRCQATTVIAVPSESQRSWWREYIALIEEGFVPCRASWSEVHSAKSKACPCGTGYDIHAFELIGPRGELVAYRVFLVCPACRGWVEF
jgi:hypothetical protein